MLLGFFLSQLCEAVGGKKFPDQHTQKVPQVHLKSAHKPFIIRLVSLQLYAAPCFYPF